MPPKFDIFLLLQQDYWPVIGDVNNKVGFLTPKMMVQVGFTPSMNFFKEPGIVLLGNWGGGLLPHDFTEPPLSDTFIASMTMNFFINF